MTTEQKKVEEFMRAFEQEVNRFPVVPSEKIRKLRARLNLEEDFELFIALGFQTIKIGENTTIDIGFVLHCLKTGMVEFSGSIEPNLKGIADALADKHYVGYCGTGAACGIDMAGVFNAVHRSNMTKFWTEKEIASEAFDSLNWDRRRVNSLSNSHVSFFIVTDRDGKVIKSPSYTPANIQL